MWKWILIGIFILGFVLRIVDLTNHPAGFNADEASFGYDAYSILNTGKDQWGNTLPLVLKSFGDDKLPVYSYLAVPTVLIFGLSELATRLPGAVLGSLSVVVIYLLVKQVFKNEKIALGAAFLLAINPWHLMLSRGAFESNLSNFFLPLGILFFLKGGKYLWLSFLFFLINIFTYHTARILTPIILIFLIFAFRDNLKRTKVFNLSLVATSILVLVSFLGIVLGGSRLATSSITDINFTDDRYRAYLTGENILLTKVFYNKLIYIARQSMSNYFSYFSPQFLLFNGAGEGTYGMVPGIGVIYLVDILFLVGFVIKIIKVKLNKENILIIFWLLISFIPASLTKGPGYAGNRGAFAIIPLIILLAIGAEYFYSNFKNKLWLYAYLILLAANFMFIGERYWVGQTSNQAKDMTYGINQVINYFDNIKDKQIVISRLVSEPQIFVAFYNKINPIEYQSATKKWKVVNGWIDQQGNYSLGNYNFRDINYSVDSKLKNTVLVSAPKDFPYDIKPDYIVSYPNQQPAYYIIVNK